MKKVGIIGGIVVLLAVVLILIKTDTATETETSIQTKTQTASFTGSPSLSVSKQFVVDGVTIERVELEKSGYVVLRGVSNGKLAQIAEVSPLLPAGVTTDITIDLLSIPEDGISLMAILYEDDGDGGFNPTLDTRAINNGTVVAVDVETGKIADTTLFTPAGAQGSTKKAAATITYTQNGYTPASVSIEKGQTVSFINNNNIPMWAASDPHPAHTILPSFDQFAGSDPGSTYQYTFDEVGTWNYHDHINPAFIGTIVVTEPVAAPLPELDKNKAGYFETDADTFAELADNPEVTMVNVHIPFAGKIPGTELSIAYNQTQALLTALPEDKNAPVALYCRGGGMSTVASKDLVAAGYTNVYDLTGGMNAYERSGRELIK